jgi:hypothetical protein
MHSVSKATVMAILTYLEDRAARCIPFGWNSQQWRCHLLASIDQEGPHIESFSQPAPEGEKTETKSPVGFLRSNGYTRIVLQHTGSKVCMNRKQNQFVMMDKSKYLVTSIHASMKTLSFFLRLSRRKGAEPWRREKEYSERVEVPREHIR